MTFQVPNRYRLRTGNYGTTDKEGNNGAFLFKLDGKRITIIASDGLGWEHVSVSLDKKKCPNWNLMCKIKDIFWDEEDAVIQYHPPKSKYVNDHPYCLHLWRPTDITLPVPDSLLVGIPK